MAPMDPYGRRVSVGGFGGGGAIAQDIWVLLGVVLVTFSLRFFSATALIPQLLELTPAVFRLGFLWQLVTYPFIGSGAPSVWFLVELLILFWFSRDAYNALGRRRFWRLTLTAAFAAGLVAALIQLLLYLAQGGVGLNAFALMQGQRTLLAIYIAAFAVLYRNATILLFFVLPVQARWFIWIMLLMAFMGYLGSKDLAGFLGLCTAVGMTVLFLTPGGWRQTLHRWQLRWRQKRYQSEMRRLRRQRGIHAVPDERGDDAAPRRGPWVH